MNLPCALETVALVASMLSPAEPKAPRDIWRQLPETPPKSVQGALYVLVRTGRATFEGEMGSRRYRLAGGT